MREAQALEMVLQFHTLFDAPILNTPQIPVLERANLRISLLQEELNEFKKAIEDNDLIEVIDALADIQYVLSGAILEFGLWDRFAEVFAEVQRSNMSKACKSLQEAEETIEYYKNQKDTEWYVVQKGEQYLVHRKNDDKILKSINYSPANIAQFIP